MVTIRRSTTERGYGIDHQKLRRRWAPKVDRGAVACFRCGGLIAPPGQPCRRCLSKGKPFWRAVRCRWDLGHDDVDRGRWTGPEHSCCNRETSTHRVERERNGGGLPAWWRR